ncbi:hypothetical protein [Streptomyces venezuelae]|uniref:hypothetical protein n=1 Tax=Streptomyces venezuelae TaxID=54571 RepID=UPI00364037F4
MNPPPQSLFVPTPGPYDTPSSPGERADALFVSVQRLRRRAVGRLLAGYVPLGTLFALSPQALQHRIGGPLSLGLLLLLAQPALVVWALADHRGRADRLDAERDRFHQSAGNAADRRAG